MIIVYKNTNRFYIGKLKIVEGENEISLQDWDSIKDHPQVKGFISDGIMVEKIKADPVIDIPQKSAKEIIEIIENIEDTDKLIVMLKHETRKTVIKAIEKQIANVIEKDDDSNDAILEAIAGVVELEQLEQLLETEEDEEVIKAIEKQIDILKEIENV